MSNFAGVRNINVSGLYSATEMTIEMFLELKGS
jgi:hypothetical protein